MCLREIRPASENADKKSSDKKILLIKMKVASYNDIVAKLEAHLDIETVDESKNQVKAEKSSSVQLEKIRMPRFDGDLREYPTFKRDFQKSDRGYRTLYVTILPGQGTTSTSEKCRRRYLGHVEKTR